MSSKGKTKKVDSRIKTLVENGVRSRHRSMFVVVGSRARDQVVNLHYMLSKARVRARPNVLWCYNKELGFISDDRSRYRKLRELAKKSNKGEKKRGQRNEEEDVDEANLQRQLEESPFNVFLAATQIRFCYFRDSHNILGQTNGMLVLQDFEGITPNVLARTMETVEGGGMIILLLPDMSSLKQLYTMAMDVHARFRSESDQDAQIVARFNERFLLSLGGNRNCLVVDDELNILPLSSHAKDIQPIILDDRKMMGDVIMDDAMKQLVELQKQLADTPLVGSLLKRCRTLDQGKAILQFIESISGGKGDSSSISTVALTAARGRGKSAALGLVMAGAVAYGYSNIFVTSPSPENLMTLFEFVFQGFDALGYSEQEDYEIVQSTNPDHNKAVVRVNVFRETHRQTIQYIEPNDAQKLGQCELLVIDEAAAIPLPLVKDLLGPYTTFISSTINGYEGTGRSLSLKLLDQLRQKGTNGTAVAGNAIVSQGPRFHEIKLEEPIRYGRGDAVERWLYDLLCLDATSAVPITTKCPHPSDCQLYYVNRDTLFSYHDASERFLHNMMSLYVSSHYKNTPNDLQIMSDAPQHHLFVLLGPIDENTTSLPDIYCVVQLCTEGHINRRVVQAHLARGESPSGDLIPYLVSRQFQEPEFAGLSGARVVRIATHPEYQRMGYGARSLDLLAKYYQGEMYNLDEEEEDENDESDGDDNDDNDGGTTKKSKGNDLHSEVIQPRDHSSLPPLLQALSERPHEKLDYLGVSYGMTQRLFNFWRKAGYEPLYLRLTENDLTGEHTCVMLRALQQQQQQSSSLLPLLPNFVSDFRRRLLSLLAFGFRKFPPQMVLSLLDFKPDQSEMNSTQVGAERSLTPEEMDTMFTAFDLKRLHAYAKNLLDYHVILDLVPRIAQLYFTGKLPFTISYTQAAILTSLGLQHKRIESLYHDLKLQSNQTLALFNKLVRKVVKHLKQLDTQRYIPQKTLPVEVVIDEEENVDNEMEVDDDDDDGGDEDDSGEEDEDDSEENENEENHKDAILSLFEKPLEENESTTPSGKKRRRSNVSPPDDDAREQKNQKKIKSSTNPLVKEVLRDNDRYSLINVQGAQLENAELDESSGTLSVTKKKDHNHMQKGKKHKLELAKEKRAKKFKAGGKKKRKFKE